MTDFFLQSYEGFKYTAQQSGTIMGVELRYYGGGAQVFSGVILLRKKIVKLLYRVFIKYCVFLKELSKDYHISLTSNRLLLVVQKLSANRSDCTLALRCESFEGLL